MKTGRPELVKWSDYEIKNLYLDRPRDCSTHCGAAVIQVLTGISAKRAEELGRKGHYSIKSMLGFLKDWGFEIVEITRSNMTDVYYSPAIKIDGSHVILADLRVTVKEDTWVVIYDEKEFHSGCVDDVDPLFAFNTPINQAWVLWHPNWEKLREKRFLKKALWASTTSKK